MALIKGILSFSDLFTAKVPKAGGDPKFSAMVLIAPDEPQIAILQAEVEQAKLNTFPSGMPSNSNVCFDLYEKKVTPDKEYHDPRFIGWYAFTCSAKAEDRPSVVDMAYTPIIDPAAVYSGMIVYMNAGISGYVKGTGGIGGWLNGIMSTGELGQFGRIDGKPTTEQMFAGVNAPAPNTTAAAPAATPPAPATPPIRPPVQPQYVMTAAANGATRDAMIAVGWTDETLISNGMMLPPAGVTTSF